jgi:thioredoxin reductase (NADPH)
MPSPKKYSVAIIGSGPAGYTAAIYAARANLSPILFEGFFSGPPGGQLMTTTEVENYPGFPEGITGPDLMKCFRDQAIRFGCEIVTEDVTHADLSATPFRIKSPSHDILASTIIIATGAMANRLPIPGTGDEEFWQKGVSSCAVCDGANPIFRNKPLFVVGGGDSAVEEGIFLTHYASQVYIVHRRDQLRASKIMQKRALEHPKVTILWDSVVTEVKGDKIVRAVSIQNVKTQETKNHEAGGLFFAVGHTPNTAFLSGQLPLDAKGYIQVKPGKAETDIPGVFAAGDVQDPHYRQAVTAAGSGCMAALEAERYLSAL